jgi:hypothetical protein
MIYNLIPTLGGTLGYSVNYWTPQIVAADASIPAGAFAEWCRQESGGNPCGLGKSYEVGILQINTHDSGSFQSWSREQLHGTGTFAVGPTVPGMTRALTADEESVQVQAAVAYLNQALQGAQAGLAQAGQSWSVADQWALAKLWHWLPALVRSQYGTGALYVGVQKAAVSSWSDYAAYLSSLNKSDVPASIQGYWDDVPRKVAECGMVGAAAGGGAGIVGLIPTSTAPRGAVVLDLLTCLMIAGVLAIGWYFAR